MQYLKQGTAATVKLGPFLADTDGKTAQTGLTISQADIRLTKNGGDFAQTNNVAGATHDEAGWYDIPLDATDTGTLGRLVVAIHESGALPVWREFMVVAANIFDSLVGGGDYLQVDAVQVEGGDATDAINAEVDTALADYDAVVPADLSSLATAAALQTVDDNVDAILLDTDELQTDDVPGLIAALNDLSAAEVNAEVDTALAEYDAVVPADLSALATAAALQTVDDNVDAILLDTDELQTDDVPGLIAALNDPSAADIADAVWDEDVVLAHNTADTAGALIDDLGTPANFKADVSALAIEANVETHVGNSLATYDPPTNAEMLAAHSTTDGLITTADAVVDAIKAVTDNLPDSGALTSIISALSTIDGVVDAILLDTGTDGVLIATGAIDADALAATGANKIADHVWRRNNGNIEDSSDGDTYDEQSPYGAIAFFTNKVAPNGSDIEVFEADGVTVFYSRTPTTDAEADPITGMTAAT